MPNAAGMHAKLIKADFHGSIVTGASSVLRSSLTHLTPSRASRSATEQESLSRRSLRDCCSRNGKRVQGDHPERHTEKSAAFLFLLPRAACTDQTPTVIPKQNSIFMFAVPLYATQALPPAPSATAAKTILDMPHIEFELYGNHFCYRAAERAGRKFKHKGTIEL